MNHSAFKLDLNEGTYELTLLKEDTLHYSHELIESLQENAKLVTASFYNQISGEKKKKTLKII